MKERYEERIQEVEGEKETLEEIRDELKEKTRQLQTALQKAQVQVDAATAAAAVAAAHPTSGAKIEKTAVPGEVDMILAHIFIQVASSSMNLNRRQFIQVRHSDK